MLGPGYKKDPWAEIFGDFGQPRANKPRSFAGSNHDAPKPITHQKGWICDAAHDRLAEESICEKAPQMRAFSVHLPPKNPARRPRPHTTFRHHVG